LVFQGKASIRLQKWQHLPMQGIGKQRTGFADRKVEKVSQVMQLIAIPD
jgi:hypothetical protein